MFHTAPPMSRRFLFRAGAALGISLANAKPAAPDTALCFALPEGDLHMQVEFHDKISAAKLRFLETSSHQHFCLSGSGQRNRDCLAGFSGSLAIAHYWFKPHGERVVSRSIRECVRTIDRDVRLPVRSPFELTIPFEQGVASDIQAFGVETVAPETSQDPWCILRQDLFLFPQTMPFLILHWKHTLRAIRILDVIPGDLTRVVTREALR